MNVLISGASVAGPALAYWLNRGGHSVTVVERAPRLRKTGGHAVDLFRPAMDIVERMGLLDRIQMKATEIARVTVFKENSERPVDINLGNIYAGISDRHVEIMRDDLSEIFYEATRGDVEYILGDSINAIDDDGGVIFEAGSPRDFDLIVGADGLHSNVRRLVFGDDSRFTTPLGAYLAVLSVPNYLELDRRMLGYLGVGRLAGIYSGAHMDDARAGFLFRTKHPLFYDHRDTARQKEMLREAFADMSGEVPRWLEELDRTPAFYFDSIAQVRMPTWSHGRVTLIGDAGYGPGPAVGGGTSLAVVGAYVLAGELAEAGGDHTRALPSYEREMSTYVEGARRLGHRAAKTLMSVGRVQVWAVIQGARLVSHLPTGLLRAAVNLATRTARVHDAVRIKDYSARAG